MRTDRYVVSGRIRTMTDPEARADWMLVDEGLVARIGRDRFRPSSRSFVA